MPLASYSRQETPDRRKDVAPGAGRKRQPEAPLRKQPQLLFLTWSSLVDLESVDFLSGDADLRLLSPATPDIGFLLAIGFLCCTWEPVEADLATGRVVFCAVVVLLVAAPFFWLEGLLLLLWTLVPPCLPLETLFVCGIVEPNADAGLFCLLFKELDRLIPVLPELATLALELLIDDFFAPLFPDLFVAVEVVDEALGRGSSPVDFITGELVPSGEPNSL